MTPVSPRIGLFAIVIAMALLLAVAVAGGSGALAAGWLAGWLFCLSACVGASVWLMIHALLGGRWLSAGRAVLQPLAMLTPLAALAGLPLLFVMAQLYPWWPAEDSARGALYLNAPAFLVRAVVILAGWSLIGVFAPRMGRGLAVPGLVFHGFVVGFSGLDWLLSRDPAFGSTVFGALLAVLQLALALHVAALWLRGGDRQAVADWGGLMLASMLGVFYLAAMQFLVIWSGNLPDQAGWYLARLTGGGRAMILLAVLSGVVVPFALLLSSRGRAEARHLRLVACFALTGGGLYLVWICAPGQAGMALVAALATAALIAGVAHILLTRAEVRHDPAA